MRNSTEGKAKPKIAYGVRIPSGVRVDINDGKVHFPPYISRESPWSLSAKPLEYLTKKQLERVLDRWQRRDLRAFERHLEQYTPFTHALEVLLDNSRYNRIRRLFLDI